jgi:hypothetical protein
MTILSEPHFHNEAAAIAKLEANDVAEWAVLPTLRRLRSDHAVGAASSRASVHIRYIGPLANVQNRLVHVPSSSRGHA